MPARPGWRRGLLFAALLLLGLAYVGAFWVFVTRSEGTFHFYAASYEALRALTDYLWEDCCKRGGGCC